MVINKSLLRYFGFLVYVFIVLLGFYEMIIIKVKLMKIIGIYIFENKKIGNNLF